MPQETQRGIAWEKLSRINSENDSPNAQKFQEGVLQLIQELGPYLKEAEENPFVVQEDLLRRAVELHLMGPGIAIEHNGLGLDAAVRYKGVTTLSYEAPGPTLTVFAVGHSLTAVPIELAANIAQGERREELLSILDGLRTGIYRAYFAITEKHHGSDSGREVELTLTDDPEGGFVLNGPKDFITNPEGADYGVVNAMYNGKTVVLLLDMNRSQEEGAFQITGYHDKISFKGPVLTSMKFTNFHVERKDILGSWKEIARPTLVEGRNVVSAIALGIAARALDIGLKWAEHRKQFGVPLEEMQFNAERLASDIEQLSVCEALLQKATRAVETGDPNASVYASIAKVVITESALKMALFAQQLLGARGVIRKFHAKNPEDDFFSEERRNTDQNIIGHALDALTSTIFEGASTLQTDLLIYPYVTDEQMQQLAYMLPPPDFTWYPFAYNRPSLDERLAFIENFVPPVLKPKRVQPDKERILQVLYRATNRYRKN